MSSAYDIGFADSNAGSLSSGFAFQGGKGKGNIDTGGLILAAVLFAAAFCGWLVWKAGRKA
jgi:hypothetical protein